MISHSILTINGKGGVGKTSLVANIAGLTAGSGWRVLAIDTDPQGNLARDLGVLPQADDGRTRGDPRRGRPAAPCGRADLAPGGRHPTASSPRCS
jgi:cellulose biosynthesis protein BcsQ